MPAADAAPVEEYVLVSSTAGRDVLTDSPGLVRLDGDDGRLLAWRHPHDPALPALVTACDPSLLQGLLPGAGPVTELELVGYRPLRRAVLRAVRDGTTTYVKVLRPATAVAEPPTCSTATPCSRLPGCPCRASSPRRRRGSC